MKWQQSVEQGEMPVINQDDDHTTMVDKMVCMTDEQFEDLKEAIDDGYVVLDKMSAALGDAEVYRKWPSV